MSILHFDVTRHSLGHSLHHNSCHFHMCTRIELLFSCFSADFFTTTANESDSDEESESQETNNTLPSDAQNKSLLPNPLANPFAPSAALSQSPLSSEVKGSVFGKFSVLLIYWMTACINNFHENFRQHLMSTY